jgi:hypothetical protein
MKLAIERAAAPFDVRLEIVDIDLDSELVRHYNEDVPVLFVNGRKFAKHRLDETRLRAKLVRETEQSARGVG